MTDSATVEANYGQESSKEEIVKVDEVPLIAWDDPREKRNPKNWPLYDRIFHTIVPCFIAFEV